MSDLSSIFVPSHCVSKAQLMSYIQGKLIREEAYLVEAHLNDCQFCNDALDAFLEADLPQAEQDLKDAKTQISEKLFPQTDNQKTISANHNNIRTLSSGKQIYKRLLAAASILLVIGLGGYTVFSFMQSNKKQLSLNEKGSGGKGYDAEYSKAESEHNEIVKLNIEENDTFRKYADEGDRISGDIARSRTDHSPVREHELYDKIAKTEVKSSEPPPGKLPDVVKSVQVHEDAVKEAEMSAAPAVAVDNARFDPSPGMENYARANRDEKIQPEEKKKIAAKKSVAGLKYDNNVQSNQMNYPRGNNNDLGQQRNVELASVQKASAEEYNDEIPMSNFEKGMENFNNKNYRKSISLFEKALKKSSGAEREDIMYHLALAYEFTGKSEKAGALYSSLSLSKSKKYGEQAERKLRQVQVEEVQRKK